MQTATDADKEGGRPHTDNEDCLNCMGKTQTDQTACGQQRLIMLIGMTDQTACGQERLIRLNADNKD